MEEMLIDLLVNLLSFYGLGLFISVPIGIITMLDRPFSKKIEACLLSWFIFVRFNDIK